MRVAQYLAGEIEKIEPFELWNKASDISVFAWMLKPNPDRSRTLYDLSDRLHMQGWQVPPTPHP